MHLANWDVASLLPQTLSIHWQSCCLLRAWSLGVSWWPHPALWAFQKSNTSPSPVPWWSQDGRSPLRRSSWPLSVPRPADRLLHMYEAGLWGHEGGIEDPWGGVLICHPRGSVACWLSWSWCLSLHLCSADVLPVIWGQAFSWTDQRLKVILACDSLLGTEACPMMRSFSVGQDSFWWRCWKVGCHLQGPTMRSSSVGQGSFRGNSLCQEPSRCCWCLRWRVVD